MSPISNEEAARRYRAAQDRASTYYQKNKEHLKAKAREWTAANREKKKEYNRRYFSKPENKERIKGYRQRYITRNKAIFDEWRAQGCSMCPEDRIVCIDAHHTNPNEKDELVSKLVQTGAAEKTLRAELDKCVAVCSNCHRVLHQE